MGNDVNANVAAAALMRLAAEESEAGILTGSMEDFLLLDLTRCNGPASASQLAITLARKHFAFLDAVAAAMGIAPGMLLDKTVNPADRMQEA